MSFSYSLLACLVTSFYLVLSSQEKLIRNTFLLAVLMKRSHITKFLVEWSLLLLQFIPPCWVKWAGLDKGQRGYCSKLWLSHKQLRCSLIGEIQQNPVKKRSNFRNKPCTGKSCKKSERNMSTVKRLYTLKLYLKDLFHFYIDL